MRTQLRTAQSKGNANAAIETQLVAEKSIRRDVLIARESTLTAFRPSVRPSYLRLTIRSPSAYPRGMAQHPPLPRRVAWFAPWTWRRRWQVAAALPTLLVAYGLSLGPALGFVGHGDLSASGVAYAYRPLLMVQCRSPRSMHNAVERYLRAWDSPAFDAVEWQHLSWDLGGLPLITPGRALFSSLDEEESLLLPTDASEAR